MFQGVEMISEQEAKDAAQRYLIDVVRNELGRSNDILIGNTYYEGEGWLFRHEIGKDLMGGNPGNIAVDEKTAGIVEYDSGHPLAKRMQDICAQAEYIRKNGYF